MPWCPLFYNNQDVVEEQFPFLTHWSLLFFIHPNIEQKPSVEVRDQTDHIHTKLFSQLELTERFEWLHDRLISGASVSTEPNVTDEAVSP
jgi:hypothetical protein